MAFLLQTPRPANIKCQQQQASGSRSCTNVCQVNMAAALWHPALTVCTIVSQCCQQDVSFKCTHLRQQAWTIGQAVLGRGVGEVVELYLVDGPALPADVDTDVNSHGPIQLIVGSLHPAADASM